MIHGLNWLCTKHPDVVLCIAILVAGISLVASHKVDSLAHRHADRKLSVFADTTWPWVMF
ncbi:hypothetical protein LMG28614_04223 [Paraburkholderia ultramafica]|uniref:Uncharacterized protein n=1 Tax=Paraburkholderia ultramafica TaxID=1544867 RepID=A0A6S7BCV4_9BURK|nr:hypothetical protein LMG28614_04223 [Paraburkholderia ultramafica]